MTVLEASAAYRLWAPVYSDETAVSFLENKLVTEMNPPMSGMRLLDAGCGTGRRIRNAPAASVVGLEPSREMLAAGIATDGQFRDVELVVGDIRHMPLDARSFDLIWCRLVLGHLAQIDQAYAELARVADDDAIIIVSDFHPAATDAGHRRSFRLGERVIEVEHYVHCVDDHVQAAGAAGLETQHIREAEIGNDVRPFYASAGRLGAFFEHIGLPVVLALSFRKVR